MDSKANARQSTMVCSLSEFLNVSLPSNENQTLTGDHTERTFRLFSESFSALPLATLIGKKYLVLHGGLFSDDKITLDDIRKLNRHNQRQPGQAGLMMEMLWTDPQTEPGRGPSKRGVGMQFGPDVTKRFCENNGLDAIIRSHEVRMEGYEEEHEGKCITGMLQLQHIPWTHLIIL